MFNESDERKKHQEELDNLEVGQEVYVTALGYYNPGSIGRLVKRAKKQLVVYLAGRELSFDADNGYELKVKGSRRSVHAVTQAHRDEIEKAEHVTFFVIQRNDFWKGMTVEQLRAMRTIAEGKADIAGEAVKLQKMLDERGS